VDRPGRGEALEAAGRGRRRRVPRPAQEGGRPWRGPRRGRSIPPPWTGSVIGSPPKRAVGD